MKAHIDQLQVEADAQRKVTEGLRARIEQLPPEGNTIANLRLSVRRPSVRYYNMVVILLQHAEGEYYSCMFRTFVLYFIAKINIS